MKPTQLIEDGMAEGWIQGPIQTTESDFEFRDHKSIIGGTYIAGSVAGILLNTLVFITVAKSHRMVKTAKYWLVLTATVAYWIQSTVTNPQMVAAWLEPHTNTSCGLWEAAAAYNRHICAGIASWTCCLMSLDYLLCVVSAPYRRRYRNSVTACLIPACVFAVLGGISVALALYGSTERPFPEVKCHLAITKNVVSVVVLSATVYAPLAGSLALTVLVVLIRYAGRLGEPYNTKQSLEASLDIQGYNGQSVFPPVDHILYLTLLIVLYVPACVFQHLVTEGVLVPGADGASLVHLAAALAVMRDNAGCLVPLVWFCFDDMRRTLRSIPCFRGKAHPSDSAFSEASEFRVYESYPYCASAQL